MANRVAKLKTQKSNLMWNHIPQKYELLIGEPQISNRHNTDFHQLGPTGPSWSRSRHVRGSVCLSVCLRH